MPPGRLDQITLSNVRLVSPPGELDESYASSFIAAQSRYYVKNDIIHKTGSTYLKPHVQTPTNLLYIITCDRRSVLLLRQCNMLRSSGFVDDVMFSDYGANGLGSKKTRMFCPVRRVTDKSAVLFETQKSLRTLCDDVCRPNYNFM